MFDYKVITQKELIVARRIVAEEIVEIDKDMEQLEKNCCFLDESFDDIQWTNSKAEKRYFELGKSKTYLKKSLQTLNHKMAVFN